MNYNESHPQAEPKPSKEALVVGSEQLTSCGLVLDSTVNDQIPPPLPPKPKLEVPPPLPPKPSSKPPPLPPRQSSNRPSSLSAELGAIPPPPLPPKPGAKPAVPQRRTRKSPSPIFGLANSGELATSAAAKIEATSPTNLAPANSSSSGCQDCAQLLEENCQLQKENDILLQKNKRMKGIIHKNIVSKNSNTCPQSIRKIKPLQSRNRLKTV